MRTARTYTIQSICREPECAWDVQTDAWGRDPWDALVAIADRYHDSVSAMLKADDPSWSPSVEFRLWQGETLHRATYWPRYAEVDLHRAAGRETIEL